MAGVGEGSTPPSGTAVSPRSVGFSFPSSSMEEPRAGPVSGITDLPTTTEGIAEDEGLALDPGKVAPHALSQSPPVEDVMSPSKQRRKKKKEKKSLRGDVLMADAPRVVNGDEDAQITINAVRKKKEKTDKKKRDKEKQREETGEDHGEEKAQRERMHESQAESTTEEEDPRPHSIVEEGEAGPIISENAARPRIKSMKSKSEKSEQVRVRDGYFGTDPISRRASRDKAATDISSTDRKNRSSSKSPKRRAKRPLKAEVGNVENTVSDIASHLSQTRPDEAERLNPDAALGGWSPTSSGSGLRMRKRGTSLEMLPSERRSRELRLSGVDGEMLRSILESMTDPPAKQVVLSTVGRDEPPVELEKKDAPQISEVKDSSPPAHISPSRIRSPKTWAADQKRSRRTLSKSDDDMRRSYVLPLSSSPDSRVKKMKRPSKTEREANSEIDSGSSTKDAKPIKNSKKKDTSGFAHSLNGRKLKSDSLSRSFDVIPNVLPAKFVASTPTTFAPNDMRDDAANERRKPDIGKEEENGLHTYDTDQSLTFDEAAKLDSQRKKDRKKRKKSQSEKEVFRAIEKNDASESGYSVHTPTITEEPQLSNSPSTHDGEAAVIGRVISSEEVTDDVKKEQRKKEQKRRKQSIASELDEVAAGRDESPNKEDRKDHREKKTKKDKTKVLKEDKDSRRRTIDGKAELRLIGATSDGNTSANDVDPALATSSPSVPEDSLAADMIVTNSPKLGRPRTMYEKNKKVDPDVKVKHKRRVSAHDARQACSPDSIVIKEKKQDKREKEPKRESAPYEEAADSILSESKPTISTADQELVSQQQPTLTSSPSTKEKRRRGNSVKSKEAKLKSEPRVNMTRETLPVPRSRSMTASSNARLSHESLRLPLPDLEAIRLFPSQSIGVHRTKRRSMSLISSPHTYESIAQEDNSEEEPSLEESYSEYLVKRMKKKKQKQKKQKQKKKKQKAEMGLQSDETGARKDEDDYEPYEDESREDQLFFAHLKSGFEHYRMIEEVGSPPQPSYLHELETEPKKKKKKKKRTDPENAPADVGDENKELNGTEESERIDLQSSRRSGSFPSRRSLSDTNLRAKYLAEQTKEKRKKLRRSRSINLLELYRTKHAHRKERPPVHITDLRPTQFTVGKLAVAHQTKKLNKMLKTCTETKLIKYIGKKTVPVVIGPGNKYYMLDRHHAARALWESEVSDTLKVLHVQILADLSELSHDEFWDKMKRNKCTYLTKNGQDPLSPDMLPQNVGDLTDDAYRSLAWAVKSRKGFKATSIPFAEFIWADFLRQMLNKELEGEEIYSVLDAALDICHSESAAHLPGYIAPTTSVAPTPSATSTSAPSTDATEQTST